jgi:hypothetical protein
LWTPSNQGDQLARTILRNLTKTGGWAHFTGNAPVVGLGSVAEIYGEPAPGALHYATRPSAVPERDWTREQKRDHLEEVYRDVPWIPRDRVLDDIDDPAQPWADSVRFFFNTRTDEGARFSWMNRDAWATCGEHPTAMRADLPTFACVRIAHDHLSGAVAYAQRQGDRVVLRSRTFQSQTEDDLDLGSIEAYLAELHRSYPARVLGLRRFSARSPERLYPMGGPEIAYNGSFFERSAQELKKAGMALIDIPNSQERIAPASEQLLELVLAERLSHDADAELTKQMGAVVAKPAVKGWTLERPPDGTRIEAAVAAMVAVDRAMKAPREPSRKVHGMHG